MAALWTDDEIEYLRVEAMRIPSTEIAMHLGRTVPAVRCKARKLKIRLYVERLKDGSIRRGWTLKEVSDLYGLSERTTLEGAAQRLKRSPDAVKKKAQKLGISFREDRMTLCEMAKILGISHNTLCRRRDKLGLTFRRSTRKGDRGRGHMRGPTGDDIIAIAKDMLRDPPKGNSWKTTVKELKQIIEEYDGWE